jgi:hypothetical protein
MYVLYMNTLLQSHSWVYENLLCSFMILLYYSVCLAFASYSINFHCVVGPFQYIASTVFCASGY